DPMPVRASVTDMKIWGQQRYRRPSDHKVIFTNSPISASDNPDDDSGQTPASGLIDVRATGVRSTRSADSGGDPPQQSPSTGRWAFPIEPLLERTDFGLDTEEEREWLRGTEIRLKNALQQFHLQAKVVSSKLTPNAALLKFAGSSSLTVDQVTKRRSELL